MLSDVASPRAIALLDPSTLKRLVLGIAVVLGILALALPMLTTDPAPLTSDESLYLSEGYNIATGVGPRYTSGDIVNHRAPLYPALLAVAIRLTGGDPASAYWVSKLVVVALAGATFLLARQLFGTVAGVLAALLVASSAYLRSLGATLYLDGTETLFMLLFLSALWKGFRSGSVPWFACAGLLLGAAFLAKEAAIQWLPLPVAFALLSKEHRNRRAALGLAAYGAAAGAIISVWWVWVYVATGRIYLWGAPDLRLVVWICAAAGAAGALGLTWLALARLSPRRLPRLALLTGLALVAAWAGLFFLFLELTSPPFPPEHLRTIPRYLWDIAAAKSQPWPLLALGLVWLAWRATRDSASRLLVLALVLFLPFALFVANRSFQYRDMLPMLYIAYLAAAGVCARYLRWAATRTGVASMGALVTLGFVALAFTQTEELLNERAADDRTEVTQANWDNSMVHATADWIHDNVPAGAHIMSGRLYFSHLYVLDRARHPISQLPTVRVEPKPGEAPFLRRITTLFRWEEHRMGPVRSEERWLSVRRYPMKGYYVGLSEWDLLRELSARSVSYLILTGEDAGFSSFTYLDYFTDNPAFELLYSDRRSVSDGVYVFRVDRRKLATHTYKAVVSEETLAALARESDDASPEGLVAAIDPDGVAILPRARTEDGDRG